jgi:ribose 1,5-bisphosphokinase
LQKYEYSMTQTAKSRSIDDNFSSSIVTSSQDYLINCHMKNGRLVFVVGASGAGKDTLLAFARQRLVNEPIVFAHRYITRPPSESGESHVPLSDAEFADRLARGLFALHWDSHGLRYAVGTEIDQWRARGLAVVVNGSRAAASEAHVRYPDMAAVLVTASPQARRARLIERGRESGTDIAERLNRADTVSFTLPAAIRIDNDGPVDTAGTRLTAVLRDIARGVDPEEVAPASGYQTTRSNSPRL